MKPKFLPIIKEKTEDYEAIEKAIKVLFRKEIYLPLLREFGMRNRRLLDESSVQNSSMSGLLDALNSGQITFNRGTFSGHLNAKISKDLRDLNAKFDRSTGTYKIQLNDLPYEIRSAISASEYKFKEKLDKIDEKLSEIIPEEFAERLRTEKLFDRAYFRVESDFQKSVRGITIAPKLTDEQRRRLSSEWSKNMQLWVRDFTSKEVTSLREKIQKSSFAGNRYEAAVGAIQDSYGVTARKAKFLARQETSLLMTKFKQTRYEAAGVEWYKWVCVKGSANHPVRPMHEKNNGKFFRWDSPPTVDEQGHRKNPGQDYNCRCAARAVVGYRPGDIR